MNSINRGGGGGATDFMDMLKAQMMTLTMVSGMQGIHGHQGAGGGGGGSNNGMTNMIYIFIVTALIDFLCKTLGPRVLLWIKEYYDVRVKNTIDKMTSKIADASGGIVSCAKTASIEITIQDLDPQNILGLAILDYITNHENTHHISYKNRNFVLNQKDVIEMNEDFKIIMKKERHLMGGKDSSGSGSSGSAPSSASSSVGSSAGHSDGATVEQLFEVFSYTKSIQEMRKFLNEIRDAYVLKIQNKLGDNIFYFNMTTQNAQRNGIKDYSVLSPNAIFSMKRFHTNRKFTNLFGPEIAAVSKRVRFFMNNRKWYDAKGIPYTLGLLLSGQAGAGKTSSIKCLANETQRHIININLNNDISKTQMENLFFNETMQVINAAGHMETLTIAQNKRIYVLEDVDCQDDIVWERTLKKPEEKAAAAAAAAAQTAAKGSTDSFNIMVPNLADKIDLSFLLNLLDGILETPGRIVIMTSNQPKMLDHALIRPGRIDVIADFKKCDHETTIEMIEFFYDVSLTEEERDRVRALAPFSLSPAELGKMMFENFGDYSATIREMESDPRFPPRVLEGGDERLGGSDSNPMLEEKEEKNSERDVELRRDATNKNTIVVIDHSSSLPDSPPADDLIFLLGVIEEERRAKMENMELRRDATNSFAADDIFKKRKRAMMQRMKKNEAATASITNDSVKQFDDATMANTAHEISAFNDSINWSGSGGSKFVPFETMTR
jgi:hypothetical protein